MVDWRSSGWNPSASQKGSYNNSSQKSSGSRQPTRTDTIAMQQRIAATGQWRPGALSEASAREVGQTNQSLASRNQTRFAELPNGRVGTIANVTTQAREAYDMLGATLAQLQSPDFMPASQGEQQPFASYFDGQEQPMSEFDGGQQSLLAAPSTQGGEPSVFGAGADMMAYNAINAVFDAVEGLGDGDFQRGLMSLITLPVTATSPLVSGVSSGVIKEGSGSNVKVFSTIKSWLSKLLTKDKIVSYVGKGGRLQYKNAQVSRINLKSLMTVGGVVGMAGYVISSALSGQAIGTRDVSEEAAGLLSMGARDMVQEGDYAGYWAMSQMAREALNDTVSALPFGGSVMESTKKYSDYANFYLDVMDKHVNTTQELEAEGVVEDQADYWLNYHTRVQEMITAEEAKRVEKFNSERVLAENEIAIARQRAAAAENAATIRTTREQIALWEAHKKRLAELEEESMRKQAEFWLEYRKMIFKMESSSGQSRLGFGLF